MRHTLFEWADVEINSEAIIINSKKELKVLSSAVINGGLTKAKTVVNLKVPLDFNHEPVEHFRARGVQLGVEPGAICLMTAAEVDKAIVKTETIGETGVAVIATAGTTNSSDVADGMSLRGGTINTIVIVNRGMTTGCMANAIMSAVEGKCKALASLDVRSKYSDAAATGTSSDAILIACPSEKEVLQYAGSATDLGYLVGKNVSDAIREAVIAREGLLPQRPLEERLAERGIMMDDLLSAAMELYNPFPNVPSGKRQEVLLRCLKEAMQDVDVCTLMMAALRADEDGSKGLLPGVAKEAFKGSNLGAPEIIGNLIATHASGGLFEFYKFNDGNSRLLSRLPPFTSEAIGALIVGASSRMNAELKGSA